MTPDQELVEKVKKGHSASFSELVNRHQRGVMKVALRMTRDLEMAEDIVQDSFIKAYQKIDSFEGRSTFKSWFYRIVINTAKNKLRSIRYNHVSLENVSLSVPSLLEAGVAQTDIRALLMNEIDSLPPKQRLALSLRIFEDLSFKEIAVIMDCPYDTAKANYRHALMKLRHKFEQTQSLQGLKDFSNLTAPSQSGRIAEVE